MSARQMLRDYLLDARLWRVKLGKMFSTKERRPFVWILVIGGLVIVVALDVWGRAADAMSLSQWILRELSFASTWLMLGLLALAIWASWDRLAPIFHWLFPRLAISFDASDPLCRREGFYCVVVGNLSPVAAAKNAALHIVAIEPIGESDDVIRDACRRRAGQQVFRGPQAGDVLTAEIDAPLDINGETSCHFPVVSEFVFDSVMIGFGSPYCHPANFFLPKGDYRITYRATADGFSPASKTFVVGVDGVANVTMSAAT